MTPSRGIYVEPLIEAQAVADLLGVTTRTLRNWRYRGEGPPCAIVGGKTRYRSSDVALWIEAQFADSTSQ